MQVELQVNAESKNGTYYSVLREQAVGLAHESFTCPVVPQTRLWAIRVRSAPSWAYSSAG